MSELTGQTSLFDLDGWSGKTSPAHYPAQESGTEKTSPAKISAPSSKKRQGSAIRTPLFLDLRGSGLLLEPSWETDGASLGEYTTHSFGESPSVAVESHLSQILEENPPPKYCLSARACQGILSRAERRGKGLPKELKEALENQSLYRGMESTETSDKTEPDGPKERATASPAQTGTACAVDVYNQSVNGETAAAVTAAVGGANTSGPKVITAGFKQGNGSRAAGVGYEQEKAPTLAAAESGTNEVPGILSGKAMNPWDSQSARVYPPDGAWHSLNANENGGQSRDAVLAFAQNQRNEIRDLNEVAGALAAEPGMKQQTFVAAVDLRNNREQEVNGTLQAKPGGA